MAAANLGRGESLRFEALEAATRHNEWLLFQKYALLFACTNISNIVMMAQEYRLGQKIGASAFGKVMMGWSKNNNKRYNHRRSNQKWPVKPLTLECNPQLRG